VEKKLVGVWWVREWICLVKTVFGFGPDEGRKVDLH
jgi:hypothetical protein